MFVAHCQVSGGSSATFAVAVICNRSNYCQSEICNTKERELITNQINKNEKKNLVQIVFNNENKEQNVGQCKGDKNNVDHIRYSSVGCGQACY